MIKKTAIIICSYNMPEYANSIVDHIRNTVEMPYDLYFIDNGSDIVAPSIYTTYHIKKNIQMIPGFLRGFELAKQSNKDYFAYWMITTSCRFDSLDNRDPLRIMLPLFDDEKVFAVQPSMIIDKGGWKELLRPRGNEPRKVFGLENICPIFRAKHYNDLGGLNSRLTYGFGVGGELYWKARKENLYCYTHDGYVMYKDTTIGYEWKRMKMTYSERVERASKECKEFLVPFYGKDYDYRFNHEYITDDMWTLERSYKE